MQPARDLDAKSPDRQASTACYDQGSAKSGCRDLNPGPIVRTMRATRLRQPRERQQAAGVVSRPWQAAQAQRPRIHTILRPTSPPYPAPPTVCGQKHLSRRPRARRTPPREHDHPDPAPQAPSDGHVTAPSPYVPGIAGPERCNERLEGPLQRNRPDLVHSRGPTGSSGRSRRTELRRSPGRPCPQVLPGRTDSLCSLYGVNTWAGLASPERVGL